MCMQSQEAMKTRLLKANVRYLASPDDNERLMAVESLLMSSWDPEWSPRRLIDEGALPNLVTCLGDDIDLIRGAAARLLGRIVAKGELEAVIEAGAQEPLKKMLDDEDPLNRQNAKEALEEIQRQKCT
jgi:HEAT repeat protein